MTREAWQAEARRNLAHPKFVASRSSIADGAQLDAVPIPPNPKSDHNLLGVLLIGTVKVSNSGTNSFVVINTNGGTVNDFFFQRIRIKADEGAPVRSSAQKRAHIELFEQISLNANKRSYPPSTQVANAAGSSDDGFPTTNKIANATTAFIYSSVFVPVGGKSCAIEIDVPALPTIGNGGTNPDLSTKGVIATSSRRIDYKAIYGRATEVVTFDSRTTPSMPSGGDFSLIDFQPKNMKPDFYGYRNTNLTTQVIAEAVDEVLINSKSVDFPFIKNSTPDLAPSYAAGTNSKTPTSAQFANSTNAMWWGTNGKRLATHVATSRTTTATITLDLLAIEWADGTTGVAPPAPDPSPTPVVPASSYVPGPSQNTVANRMGAPAVRRVA